jgi:hypothetical protein
MGRVEADTSMYEPANFSSGATWHVAAKRTKRRGAFCDLRSFGQACAGRPSTEFQIDRQSLLECLVPRRHRDR